MAEFTGLGVGPGDPELQTLKAVRILENAQVICYVSKENGDSLALDIVCKALPGLREKEKLAMVFPMTKDAFRLERAHEEIAASILHLFKTWERVVCITLGDPGFYATYYYIQNILQQKGIQTSTVCGIPSFCQAAAMLQIPLVLGGEQCHIIPSSYPIEKAMELEGTLVFMKAGRKYEVLRELLHSHHSYEQVYLVENCGLEGERVAIGLENLPSSCGYFTVIIVKGNVWRSFL